MDIKQLKFLIALDETRHFGQAAACCHVTQPTLSMRLRSLEEELGITLVARAQRFEGFTPEGARVLAWARRLLAAHEGLLAEASACRGQLVGTLRVGVVPLASIDPMALLKLYRSEHPHLSFQLSSLSSEQILAQLASNQIDLGLSYLEHVDHQQFRFLRLSETAMGLLYDRRYFSFQTASCSWSEVASLPLGLLSGGMHFRQSVDHGFRTQGLAPEPVVEADAVQTLVQAVGAGLCCAVVPLNSGLELFGDELQLLPIRQANTLAPLGLIMRRQQPCSILAQTCFDMVRNNWPGAT